MSNRSAFTDGALAVMCIYSLLQDWRGKEAYVRHILENWMDPMFSVPLALLGLAYVVFNAVRSRLRPPPENFRQYLVRGAVRPEDIDVFIGMWHSQADDIKVYDFLGLSKEEYDRFVEKGVGSLSDLK